MDSCVSRARKRAFLLATAATMSIVIGNSARAQEHPTDMILEAQDNRVSASIIDPNIVIAPPGTSVTDRDPVNVTGVGQMVIDQKNGFIGLCTGTLINPRTVIFAAHCVNESPAGTAQDPWGYGTGTGQLPIGFGFQANNNVAGNSAFGHWLNGTAGGAKYLTSISEYMYNVNQVQYNPHSLDLGLANNFIQGDVAVASLDTPAANVPTWALLFSALPAPASINDTTGTGYHVVINGYGNTGTATSGSNVGVDYRRRVAENYLGLLGSLDDIDIGLFGITPRGRPQNLYQIDFDSAGHSNQFDFNIFKDNALPKEGITGPGDSGGPLILDQAYAKQLVIAVLSGGTRYFAQQPSGSYGTSAFYQPLYLFWDYIAAANPYRYVSAVAGDGAWTDPTHWVTTVDPAYNVLVNGKLVNGVPTAPGDGIAGTSGKFGQICDQEPAFQYDVCYDVKTGVYYDHGVPQGGSNSTATGTQTADATKVADTTNDGARATKSSIEEAQNGGQATGAVQAAAALPAATLANGLPGATNFVPNNIDPNAASHTNARYFDVTLSAAGTTTLSSAVTVDRFTMNGPAAKLTVASGGSLTSLININHFDGLVTNNGTITTIGDYLLLSGGITGSGRFNTPFFTSVSGTIAPGTIGTTGTITIGGNLILASGNHYLVDLGPNGVSDKIVVVPNGSSTGTASLGGFIGFAPATGYTIRAGDTYTVLTTTAPIDGTTKFIDPAPLSAILTPRLTYQATSVSVTIDAGLYANVVGNTPVQQAYARLLDQDRIVYNRLTDLYGILDMQNAATIRSTLEGLAPRAETTRRALGTASVDNMGRFYRDRLASLDPGSLGGTVAMIGKPFQIAALASSGMPGTPEVRSDAGEGMVTQEGRLPETMSAFVAGGYIDGNSSSMPTAVPVTGRDQFHGFFVATGLETEIGSRGLLGFSLAYTDLDGAPSLASHQASSTLYQGTLYGKIKTTSGAFIDATFSAGAFNSRTVRNVNLAGTSYRLVGKDRSLMVSGEIGAGTTVALGSSVALDPRVSLRGTRIMFDTIDETGGGPAMAYKPGNLDSLQARAGFNAHGNSATVKPYVSAYWVHDFAKQPGFIGANFVGGVGPNALFAVAGSDNDWAEVSGGVTFSASKRVELSVGANTTVGRKDVTNQSYHGTIRINF